MFKIQNRPIRVCATCNKDFVAITRLQRFCCQQCTNLYPLNLAKERFRSQKYSAGYRGVEFLLTYEEWWKIWNNSGQYANRGKNMGQYVMARFGDKGPYAVGNVKIVRAEENNSEKILTPENVALIKQRNTGNKYNLGTKHSEKTREAKRQFMKGNKYRLGIKHTNESKAKISSGLKKMYKTRKAG